jgi:hypothetical protein
LEYVRKKSTIYKILANNTKIDSTRKNDHEAKTWKSAFFENRNNLSQLDRIGDSIEPDYNVAILESPIQSVQRIILGILGTFGRSCSF